MKSSDSKSLFNALDNFEAKQKSLKAPAPNVCATYELVKPVLAGILPFLGFIPGIGARIVNAIRALMAALDVFCPKA